MENVRPRYNAAPSQEILVIRENHKTGERSLDLIKWGLIPYCCADPKGGRKPINAKAESVSRLPTFKDAYTQRRCIVPVDGFFEWRAIKGARAKQPYAIAMKDGSPFGLAGLWENWRNPKTGEWERTFAILTVPSNELVGQIHDRMPAILEPGSYERWLRVEPDPHDLLITYPSEPMKLWPISVRVNTPDNDDPSLLDRTGDPFDVCGLRYPQTELRRKLSADVPPPSRLSIIARVVGAIVPIGRVVRVRGIHRPVVRIRRRGVVAIYWGIIRIGHRIPITAVAPPVTDVLNGRNLRLCRGNDWHRCVGGPWAQAHNTRNHDHDRQKGTHHSTSLSCLGTPSLIVKGAPRLLPLP